MARLVFTQTEDSKKPSPGFIQHHFSILCQRYAQIHMVLKLATHKAPAEAAAQQFTISSDIWKSVGGVGDLVYPTGKDKPDTILQILNGFEDEDVTKVSEAIQSLTRKPLTEDGLKLAKEQTNTLMNDLFRATGRGKGSTLLPDQYPARNLELDTIYQAILMLWTANTNDPASIVRVHNLRSGVSYYDDAHALAYAFAAYLISTDTPERYDEIAQAIVVSPNTQLAAMNVMRRASSTSAFFGGAAFAGQASTLVVFRRYLESLRDFFDPTLHPRLSIISDLDATIQYANDKLKPAFLSSAMTHAESAFESIRKLSGSDVLLPPAIMSMLSIPDLPISDTFLAPDGWDGIFTDTVTQAIFSLPTLSAVAAKLSSLATVFRFAVDQHIEGLAIATLGSEDPQSPNILNIPADIFYTEELNSFDPNTIPYASLTSALPIRLEIPRYMGFTGRNPWILAGLRLKPIRLLHTWRKKRDDDDGIIFPGRTTLAIKLTNVHQYASNLIPFCYAAKHVQSQDISDVDHILRFIAADKQTSPERYLQDLAFILDAANDKILPASAYAYAVAGMFRTIRISNADVDAVAEPAMTQSEFNMLSDHQAFDYMTTILKDANLSFTGGKVMCEFTDLDTSIEHHQRNPWSTRIVYGVPWVTMNSHQPLPSDDWYNPARVQRRRFVVVITDRNHYFFLLHRYYPNIIDPIRIPYLLESRSYLSIEVDRKRCFLEAYRSSDDAKKGAISSIWKAYWSNMTSKPIEPGTIPDSISDLTAVAPGREWFDNPSFISVATLYPHVTYQKPKRYLFRSMDNALDQFLFTNVTRGMDGASQSLVVSRQLRHVKTVMMEAEDELHAINLKLEDVVSAQPQVAVVQPSTQIIETPTAAPIPIKNDVVAPPTSLAGDASSSVNKAINDADPDKPHSPGVEAARIVDAPNRDDDEAGQEGKHAPFGAPESSDTTSSTPAPDPKNQKKKGKKSEDEE